MTDQVVFDREKGVVYCLNCSVMCKVFISTVLRFLSHCAASEKNAKKTHKLSRQIAFHGKA